jgi:hypothetical protein
LSEAPKNQFVASLRLFVEIARLRRGPEDLPVSSSLLATTIVAYFLVSLVLTLLLPHQSGQIVAPLVVDVILVLLWLALLLRLARKPERFMQTATAFFGFQLVLAPLFMVGLALVGSYGEDPSWQVPVMLLVLVLGGWALAANTRILASATGWPLFLCVALVLMQALVIRSALLAIFPEVQASAAATA